MCGLVLVYTMAGILLLASCSTNHDILPEDNIQTPADVPVMVSHEVTVSLGGDATTRVVAEPGTVNEGQQDTDGLLLKWSANETLGVYIKGTDNSITRAGSISSFDPANDTNARTFTGKVKAKQAGESYIYMHPDLGESNTSIQFTSQQGALGDAGTAHVTNYLPLIWQENGGLPAIKGFVVHVKMQFMTDPGQIKKVTLESMAQGTEDKIFQKEFSLSSSQEKVSAIVLTVDEGTAVQNTTNNFWEADAYLVCAQSDANVYRSKYHVEVLTADNTKYNMCQYLSFPGQQDAQNNTQPMLDNGKLYNLTAQFGEPGICKTLINSEYNVHSLLGMWNTYGRPYDPCGLIYNGSNYQLPDHVADIIGDAGKQTVMMSRMLVGKSTQGTPTFTSSFPEADNITIIGKPTEVYVTFLSEFAWSQNLLGYYHYETLPASSDAAKKNIIFANMSKGNHVPFNKGGINGAANVNPNTERQNVAAPDNAPLNEFTTVKLIYTDENGFTSTTFPFGTTIGFFMMVDPKASGLSYKDDGSIDTDYTPRDDGTLLNWQSARYFTNRDWNTNYRYQVFVSGGLAVNGEVKPGLAVYGARDNVGNNFNYAYSAMLFMVSTGNANSMNTNNAKAFNIGTGDQVISNP